MGREGWKGFCQLFWCRFLAKFSRFWPTFGGPYFLGYTIFCNSKSIVTTLGYPSIEWIGVLAPTQPRKKALSVNSQGGSGGSENFEIFNDPSLLNQNGGKSKNGFYWIPSHMPRHDRCSFALGMSTKWFPAGAQWA